VEDQCCDSCLRQIGHLLDTGSGQEYRRGRQLHLMEQPLLGIGSVYIAYRARQVLANRSDVPWRRIEHRIDAPTGLDVGLDRTAIDKKAPHDVADRAQNDAPANQNKLRMPLQKWANKPCNLSLGAQFAPRKGCWRICRSTSSIRQLHTGLLVIPR
jgi:hypothetical protein